MEYQLEFVDFVDAKRASVPGKGSWGCRFFLPKIFRNPICVFSIGLDAKIRI